MINALVGQSLIGFAILYNNCTGRSTSAIINRYSFFSPPLKAATYDEFAETKSRIIIVQEKPLTSFILHYYLWQKRIPVDIAKRFCKEVIYSINGKEYFAISFKNNAGGYEPRNAFFKGSSSPKDVTAISNNTKEVAVFEDFSDFLSFIAIMQDTATIPTDFIILNSISFFEKARPFMEQYKVINLYLDNDKTGQNCREKAMSIRKKKQR